MVYGGEAIGKGVGQHPRAVSTHAQTGQINPPIIDTIILQRLIQHCVQLPDIEDFTDRTLRRDNDEREILVMLDPGGQSVAVQILQVIAAFARTMQI